MVPKLAGVTPSFASAPPESLDSRADAVFHAHQQALYEQTDRLFAYLMIAQWIAAIFFALVVAPRTWAGAQSQIHVHVWAALILGGLVSVFPAALALLRPGDTFTRFTIATAQMLMGALLIHLTGGRIETHFHVFGSLAILAFYRDWRVLVPATVVVALDHMLRGLVRPESVYGVVSRANGAGWSTPPGSCRGCVPGHGVRARHQELREIAVRTAVLEEANRAVPGNNEQGELISRSGDQQTGRAATRAKSESWRT